MDDGWLQLRVAQFGEKVSEIERFLYSRSRAVVFSLGRRESRGFLKLGFPADGGTGEGEDPA